MWWGSTADIQKPEAFDPYGHIATHIALIWTSHAANVPAVRTVAKFGGTCWCRSCQGCMQDLCLRSAEGNMDVMDLFL